MRLCQIALINEVCNVVAFGLDGNIQMDPREIFLTWLEDVVPGLQPVFYILTTQQGKYGSQ